ANADQVLLVNVDGATVVIAVVRKVLAQVSAAELEQVVSLDPGDIVPDLAIVAVPVASANVLVGGVVRAEYRIVKCIGTAVLATHFQSSGVAGNVRHAARVRIGPIVAGEAVAYAIGDVGRDFRGQAGSIDPRDLRFVTNRSILTLGIAGEESADVPLV